MYRELANPATYKIVSEEDYPREIEAFKLLCADRNLPCFESLYTFEDGDKFSRWDKQKIKLDRIKVELDSEMHGQFNQVTLLKARTGIEWLLSMKYEPRINFSGNSGIQIELRFDEVEVKNKHDTIRQFTKMMNKKMGGILDDQAFRGARQLFRVKNSRHQKSSLYAIPLTIDEVFNLDAAQILDLAKSPREFDDATRDDERLANADIPLVLKQISKDTETRFYKPREITPGVGKKPLKPCIQALMNSGQTSHEILVSVGIALVSGGYTDDEIHEILRKMSERSVKYKYNPETTTYQLKYLRQKNYHERSCKTLKELGFCIVPTAKDQTECVPMLANRQVQTNRKKLTDI